jgi:hypothetical protein
MDGILKYTNISLKTAQSVMVISSKVKTWVKNKKGKKKLQHLYILPLTGLKISAPQSVMMLHMNHTVF